MSNQSFFDVVLSSSLQQGIVRLKLAEVVSKDKDEKLRVDNSHTIITSIQGAVQLHALLGKLLDELAKSKPPEKVENN